MKHCKKCKKTKLKTSFYKNSTKPDGLQTWCKRCSREVDYQQRYGLDAAARKRLLKKQRGACAICKDPLKKATRNIDHCHKTKTVRGILCHTCNMGLGSFRDRPDLLRAAACYLEILATKPLSQK